MGMEKNCIHFMKNKKKDSPALQFKKYLKMKIGLNQPNGFQTHFAKDPSKYLDNNNESKSNINKYKIRYLT